MAISWGPVASAGGSREFRVGLEYDTIPAPTPYTTTATLTCRIYIWTRVNVTESLGVLSWSGFPGSGSLSGQNFSTSSGTAWSTANIKHVHTVSTVASLSRAAYGQSLTASASGITYMGRSLTATHTENITVPARPYALPPGTSAPTVVRGSDTSHTLSWSVSGSDVSPVEAVSIERTTGTGGWVRVAWLNGAPSSWVDQTTQPNQRYQYRTQTWNGAGYSGYSGLSPVVYTTPDTPSRCMAEKTTAGSIDVAWGSTAPWASSYEIQRAITPTGAFATLATIVGTTYNHASPIATETHCYRVRALAPGGLASPWSAPSNVVQLLTAPYAPTNLIGPLFDQTEPWTITWQHNPVDTTAQTQYRLRWHPQGSAAAWTTDAIRTSSVSTHTFPAGAFSLGTTPLEWQVQTRGQAAEWSPWSAVQVSTQSRRPVMSITAPSGVLQSGRVSAAWTYFDLEGTEQAGWQLRLLVDGAVVETRSGSGNDTAIAFMTTAPDGSTVRVEGEARDSIGMWSLTARGNNVSVVYAPPDPPEASISYDPESGRSSITITNPATSPVAVSNRILADDGDGGWRIVADNVPPNTAVTDTTPPLGVEVRYRVEATSALPSTAATTVAGRFDPQARWWLTTPSGVAEWLEINPSWQPEVAASSETVSYVGRKYQTVHSLGAVTQQSRFTATIYPRDGESVDQVIQRFEALADSALPVCFRTPTGRRTWCWLQRVSSTASSHLSAQLELSLTRIGSLDARP